MKYVHSAISASLITAFATMLLPPNVAAQLNGSGDPFHIDGLSTGSTLPGPDGLNLVSVSFRITNTRTSSLLPPLAGLATIAFGTNSATLDVPALAPGATAYVSRTVQTASSQVAVSIAVIAKPPVIAHKDTSPKATPNITASPAAAPLAYTINVAGDLGRWQSVGPFKIATSPPATGRVTTIAVDPRNPEIVYAGARGSGLWRTLGIRMIWLPITDSLPSQQIEALALDPNNPDHLVIATDAGVFESLNDGSVWTRLNSTDLNAIGSDGGRLLIAHGDNPAMLVTTRSGVLASTDGGRSWKSVLSNGGIQASSIQLSSTDSTHLFATLGTVNGPGPQPGVFEAVNGGTLTASWHQLQGCPSAPLPSFPLSSNIWVAESNGSMWVSYRTGGADNDQVGLLRSTSDTCTDNGFTEHGWQAVSPSKACSDFTNNWSYLFVDPNDPSIVYKGGIHLCRITGSGASSSLMSNIHDDQHAIAVAPSNPSVVYFGSDGGIYRSNDQGKTLSFAGEGMGNTELLKADVDGTGYAIIGASQDNGIESWDGTSSSVWKDLDFAIAGDGVLVSVDQANPASFYWMSQSTRQIYKGTSTLIGDASLDDCQAYQEFPAKVFVGMASTGTTPAIYVTCNGLWTGPPWKQVQTAGGKFTRVGFTRGSLGIVVAATDAGEVFYGIASQPPLAQVFHASPSASASSITFSSQITFYVSMNTSASGVPQGIIYRLQCLVGCTSENIWPGNSYGEITAITVDPQLPDSLLAAIRNKGIFRGVRTADGTWTWSPYNNGLPAAITITDLKASLNGSIAAVSYGRGAYKLTSNLTVPNVLSFGQAAAIDILTAVGLVPKIVFQHTCTSPGNVLVQSPHAGTPVPPGSTVTLTVDSGNIKTCTLK